MASVPANATNAELRPLEFTLDSNMADPQPTSRVLSTTSQTQEAMVHKIKSLRLSNTNPGPYKPCLLSLPRELRGIIYSYALVSPTTRWTIRHAYDCKHRDRTANIESPPFTFPDSLLSMPCGRCEVCRIPKLALPCPHDPYFNGCRCARRHSALNLLLTCKQVFEEAAKVWYANNTICLPDEYVMSDYLEATRPKLKNAIRSISVIGLYHGRDRSERVAWRRERYSTADSAEVMWKFIPQCEGLQRLELRPEHLAGRLHDLTMLRARGCKEIVMVMCVVPTIIPPWNAWTWRVPSPVPCPLLKGVYFIVKKDVDKSWDSNDCFQQQISHFQSVVVPQCQEAGQVELNLILKIRPKDFTSELSPMKFTLKFGKTQVVDILGLPATTAHRVKMGKMEKIDQDDKRAKGLLTPREEELKILRDKAHEAKRNELYRAEGESREKVLLERQARKEALLKEERLKEKKKATRQRSKLQTKTKMAEQERSRERKRVGGS